MIGTRPVLAVLLVAFMVSAQETIDVSLPATPPPNTPGPVNPSFAGFGIEPSNLFSFLGFEDSPNELTINLLTNLAAYTGGHLPHIRIGGNTQDYMAYDPSLDIWSYIINPHPKGTGHVDHKKSDAMLIGPPFFEAANRLPKGSPVTWGLNMADQDPGYLDRIASMAGLVLDKCDNLDVISFEIGNEPDLYIQNGFRTMEGATQWGGRAYVQSWNERAHAVWEKVLKPRGRERKSFETGCTASTIGTDFQIRDLATFAGLTREGQTQLEEAEGSSPSMAPYLAAWNQHDYYYYIGVSTYPISLERLTNLVTTEIQFKAWEEQLAQARDLSSENITSYYAIREMGIVGPVGLSGVTDTFGGALWSLNFLLYAAGIGVDSVQLHMTDNSAAGAWRPIDLPNDYDGGTGGSKGVKPVYYGLAAFDQIVLGVGECDNDKAQGDGGGRARVARLPYTFSENGKTTKAGDVGAHDAIRVYAVYRNDLLRAMVVVNGMPYNSSTATAAGLRMAQDEAPRVKVRIELPQGNFTGRDFHLSYLTAKGADSKQDVQWNGISFEANEDGTPSLATDARESEVVTITSDGHAELSVRYSEAVVASLDPLPGLVDTGNGTAGGCSVETPSGSPFSSPSSSQGGGAFPGTGSGAEDLDDSEQGGSCDKKKSAASPQLQVVPFRITKGFIVSVIFAVAFGLIFF